MRWVHHFDVEPEEIARRLCERAGVALQKPLPVSRLVSACLGPRAVRVADPGTIHGHTKLLRLGNDWRIYVQRGLPQAMETSGVLRRLVEWELLQAGYTEEHRGDLIEAAGALLDEAVDLRTTGPKKATAKRATGGPRKASSKRGTSREKRTG